VMLAVPDLAREAANMMVVDETGNPADIYSFGVQCQSEGETWWACRMPIGPDVFAKLPAMAEVTGGVYEVVRAYDNASEYEYMTFDEALLLHDIYRVEANNE
jgi:hypothetical protein